MSEKENSLRKILLLAAALICIIAGEPASVYAGLPKQAVDCFKQGNSYFKNSSFKLAADQYNSALKALPGDPELIYRRDYCLNKIGLCPNFKDFRNYDGLFFDPALSLIDRGSSEFEEQNFANAILLFNQALKQNPGSALAHVDRATVYCEMKEYQKAIYDYDQAIRMRPHYAKAYQGRGNIFNLLGDYRKARTDLDTAINLNPVFGLAYYNRGIVRSKQRDFKGAIDDYSKALKCNDNPRRADSYYMRALAKLEISNARGAEQDLRSTLSISPNHRAAYATLSDLTRPPQQQSPSYDIPFMSASEQASLRTYGNIYKSHEWDSGKRNDY